MNWNMLNGKTILAVVPARSGSKGIPGKNMRLVKGKSLIGWAGETLSQLPFLDAKIISTDSTDYAKEGERYGLDAPFLRPPHLSTDEARAVDTIQHALVLSEKYYNMRFDIVIIIEPTSPLRRPEHVMATITKLIDGGYDAVWTVSPTDSKNHPLKQLVFVNDILDFYDPHGASIIARQQLNQLYHRNGAAYVLTRECLLEQQTIMGKRCSAIVIEDPMVNIDTMLDLDLAEFFLTRR